MILQQDIINMKKLILILLGGLAYTLVAQVGINTESPKQMLDVEGKINIGNDTIAPTNGAVRYAEGNLEFYNGKWQTIAISSQKNNEPIRINDVEYGTHPRHKYNIYLPAEINQNTKVIVLLHGGGMVVGDKDQAGTYRPFFNEMIRQMPDYVLITSNYRYKNGRNVWVTPQITSDIQTMLRHSQSEFNLPYNYFLTGNSAGGTLSIHAAFRGTFPLRGIIPITAPWDYTHSSVQDIPDLPGAIRHLASPEVDTRGMSEPLFGSPKTFFKSLPFLAINGDNDALIPMEQLELMIEDNANNFHFEYRVYQGDHMAFRIASIRNWMISEIKLFAEKH